MITSKGSQVSLYNSYRCGTDNSLSQRAFFIQATVAEHKSPDKNFRF